MTPSHRPVGSAEAKSGTRYATSACRRSPLEGIISKEFPHLLRLLEQNQPTHGSSLRIFGRHAGDVTKPVTARVAATRRAEVEAGLTRMETYRNFQRGVRADPAVEAGRGDSLNDAALPRPRPDAAGIGDPQALYRLCRRLYPIGRSITGPGVRETLSILCEHLPLDVHEVPSGTRVFDWEVPPEWTLRSAWVETPSGERVIDAARHNLHVVGYSTPVDRTVSRRELEQHLHSLPGQPDLIPYRTSYYRRDWGFCVADRVRRQLPDGRYRVRIDATLEAGVLNYGEFFVPGTSDREILVSTHLCHPSLANDNLSGLAVAAHLAAWFAAAERGRYGLRFVFVPGTIGAITWLAVNQPRLARIDAGLVLSGVGDSGAFTYKRSRHGAGLIDRLFARHLADHPGSTLRDFTPYGYDERQYCSPGIGIAAGCLMRTPYREYPQYHTSGDDLALISGAALAETFGLCVRVLEDAQQARCYRNLNPHCEPQLGRRGLYDDLGGDNDAKQLQLAMLWLLSFSDGDHSTADIAERAGMPAALMERAAELLESAQLLEAVDP